MEEVIDELAVLSCWVGRVGTLQEVDGGTCSVEEESWLEGTAIYAQKVFSILHTLLYLEIAVTS